MDSSAESSQRLRLPGWAGWCLVLFLAAQGARIATVLSRDEATPFLSANDRSRWGTVAALVEDRTYAIDRVVALRVGPRQRTAWQTIDRVVHPGRDGLLRTYSSKPPLLATLVAVPYQFVHWLTGLRLTEHPLLVGRVLLLLVNLLPAAMALWWWARWLGQSNLPVWSQQAMLTLSAWGLPIVAMVVTLNNHLPGVFATALSFWCTWLVLQGDRRWWPAALAGLSGAMAVACELPALSWLAASAALVAWHVPSRMLTAFLPGALPILVASLATNYLAHDQLRPPYAQRSVGPRWVELDTTLAGGMTGGTPVPLADDGAGPADGSPPLPSLEALVEGLERAGQAGLAADRITLRSARQPAVWEILSPELTERVALATTEQQWWLHHWGDWYDYPGSYWLPGRQQGVDRGEPSRAIYAVHMLVGHHGVLSLTPFWILAVIGLGHRLWPITRQPWRRLRSDTAVQLAVAAGVVSLVCVLFFIARPLIDRNYGGVSCGFRWLFWLSPIWLWLSLPAVAAAAKRGWTRRAVEWLVLVSSFSVLYNWANPWQHPWLYDLMGQLGWLSP